MLEVLSLGAGVQSSVMAIMAARGELTPMPNCAIFADTGDEPKAVYDWLAYLIQKLPFPVHTVRGRFKRLSDEFTHITKSKNGNYYQSATPPAHVFGDNKDKGMLRRDCTTSYKIRPIQKFVRGLLKQTGEKKASMWIGISTDEAVRMKPSRVNYIENKWPLIDARMSRSDCLGFMERNGYPRPPRSACVYCPFKSDIEWQQLKDNAPKDFAEAVRIEKNFHDGLKKTTRFKTAEAYFHKSGKPLNQVEFVDSRQADFFNNECEGMCGL
jgi:hypothetical protein